MCTQLEQSFPKANLTVERSEGVGPIMGTQLATNSLFALGIAILGILLYVTVRFEFSFAIGTIVAMLHDLVITLGIFVMTGHEFSLVMVGAILTVAGYSINDKIVVFDRIREGLRSGRKGSIQYLMNASINETLSRTILTSGVTLLCMLSLPVFRRSGACRFRIHQRHRSDRWHLFVDFYCCADRSLVVEFPERKSET